MDATRKRLNLAPYVGLFPGVVIFVVVFIGCTLFSIVLSFTSSGMLPRFEFVGLEQYEELLTNRRFRQTVVNIAIYGPVMVGTSIVLGTLMAIFVDQRVRAEGVFRSLYLYPHAVSFIVTGLLWRWFFDPTYGIETVLADLGLPQTGIGWLSDPNTVLYTLVVAGVWHSAGLVMVIMLAGLRSVDEDLWKAARVDGIPAWRTYVSIILPMVQGAIVTCVILLSISVIKVYDLVVAMTGGGPGFASDMPAKFVLDSLFERHNVGLASAGVVVMLLTVVIIFAPAMYVRSMRLRRAEGAGA